MSGFQTYFTGTVVGDHTGDGPKSIFDKQLTMFQELFGAATNSYAAATLVAASVDNYDPWGAAPPQDFRLAVTPAAGGSALTGLRAGFDGQRGTIFNPSTVDTLTLNKENTSSTAAKRFTGQGDSGIPPGGRQPIVYNLLPNPRWDMG
jgi:hypothetical protein